MILDRPIPTLAYDEADDAVALVAGNVRLASVPRGRPSGGVEAGDLDLLARTAPMAGAAALGRMMAGLGHAGAGWARLDAGGAIRDLVEGIGDGGGSEGPGSAPTPEEALTVEDAYFLHDRAIAVRCRLGGDGQATLRAYQPDPAVPWLFMADQALLRPGRLHVEPIALRHPWLPVLLVAVDPEERLLATRLIAFPSLLRGGMHHGEALLGGDGSLGGIDRLAALLGEVVAGARPGLAEFVVSGVEVDMDGAIGTEPMFSASVAGWLRFMGVALEARGGDGLLRLRHVAPSLRVSDHLLRLGAQAVPSLEIITARAPLDDDVDVTTGSTIDVAASSLEPKLSIALPDMPIPGPLAAAVPGAGAPRLVRRSAPVATRFALGDTVMAIRSCSFAVPPGVPDVFGPDPRAATADAHRASICVIVVADPDRPVAGILDTLSRRPGAAATDVVIVGTIDREIDASRFASVRNEPGEGRVARLIDAAVGTASAEVIVIVFAGINPVDPAVIDHLVASASLDGVADVACAGLSGPAIDHPDAMRQSTLGRFAVPALSNQAPMPQPRWHEVPAGLWPVSSNRATVLAVRRSVYELVGGLDRQGEGEGDAAMTIDATLADLAGRARAQGLVSLCDSRLAVLMRGDAVDDVPAVDRAVASSRPGRVPTLTRF